MKTYNYPPKVSNADIAYNLLMLKADPLLVYPKNIKKYGATFYLNLPLFKYKIIVTQDPNFIEHVLQKNQRNYSKSPLQTESLAKYVGKGILTNDGEDWKRQRKFIQPSFNKGVIENFSNIMLQEIKKAFDKIPENTSFDIYETMNGLTFRIIAKCLFGDALNDEQVNEISARITSAQNMLVKEFRKPYYNWWYNFSGAIKDEIKKTEEIRQIFKELILARKESVEKHDDMLNMLLEARYEDNHEPMSNERLVDELIIIFVAGHETTGIALSWIIYLLSKHPDAIEKIKEENQLMGEDIFKTENLIKPSFTMACVNEAMRLYPPAWAIDRIAKEDDAFGNFSWEKGAIIIAYIHGMHRNPHNWADAELFKPERLMGLKKLPDNFLPFGAGPRMCIGNHFAMMEMVLTIRWIFNNVDIEVLTKNVEPIALVTLRPDKITGRLQKLDTKH
jgi:cytochrome P450